MTQSREGMLNTPLDQTLESNTTARGARSLSLVRRLRDYATFGGFGAITFLSWLLLIGLVGLLVVRSLPLLTTYPLGDLIAGQVWQPAQDLFGLAPFLVGSLAVTALAMFLAVPPAILGGIYLAEFTTTRARNILKPVLDLLVGIPSVVYGLWGVLFVIPLLREYVGPWSTQTLGTWLPFFKMTNPSGYSLLAGGIVLAIMVFPFIVAITDEVLRTVPAGQRESLLALGATRWEATKTLVRHSAAGGIGAAVILGFSRAFGETLAVLMVVGNSPQIPKSIFDGAYPLPALIANNYGEMMSVPRYEAALMTAALLLLAMVLIFNAAAALVVNRLARRYEHD